MIGLGIMGSAMSANLMQAGYPVIGYDVLPKRRQAHRPDGDDKRRPNHDASRVSCRDHDSTPRMMAAGQL